MVHIDGRDWSTHQAERAFPILVQWAEHRKKGTYQELAGLLRIHPRPLPMALGTLGHAIQRLNESSETKPWSTDIPPIELLVCTKNRGVPGDLGLKWFSRFDKSVDYEALTRLPLSMKREFVRQHLDEKIFDWPNWRQVLTYFKLKPLAVSLPPASKVIGELQQKLGAGESEEHKRLRLFIYENPLAVSIHNKIIGRSTEHCVLSGDRLDVFFQTISEWICVEVKPSTAPESDLIRGMFQCVKYQAVLQQQQAYERLQDDRKIEAPKHVSTLLALTGEMPKNLKALQERLGTKVLEKIKVPSDFVPTKAVGVTAT